MQLALEQIPWCPIRVQLTTQCPSDARACVKVINIKPSSDNSERVTSVIPIWTADIPSDLVWVAPLGRGGEEGVKIYVEGGEYAG